MLLKTKFVDFKNQLGTHFIRENSKFDQCYYFNTNIVHQHIIEVAWLWCVYHGLMSSVESEIYLIKIDIKI